MLKRIYQTNAPLTITGLLMIPAFVVAIFGLFLDPRIITGVPAWLKPAKFSASIAIYVLTLAWIFTLLPGWKKTRFIVGWTTAIVMLLELAIIDFQAYRGNTSHFNFRTPLDGFLFSVMGMAIVTQTTTSIAVAVALWCQEFQDRALGWALRLGMTITILGAFSAGLMVRPTAAQLAKAHAGQQMTVIGAHTVGAPDGGPGIPGTGWSTNHGDLRVGHFAGLHALQVLALVAWALRRNQLSADSQVRFILVSAASYFLLCLILLAQALRGQPLISSDILTVWTFGLWAFFTALCAWIAVGRSPTISSVQVL